MWNFKLVACISIEQQWAFICLISFRRPKTWFRNVGWFWASSWSRTACFFYDEGTNGPLWWPCLNTLERLVTTGREGTWMVLAKRTLGVWISWMPEKLARREFLSRDDSGAGVVVISGTLNFMFILLSSLCATRIPNLIVSPYWATRILFANGVIFCHEKSKLKVSA